MQWYELLANRIVEVAALDYYLACKHIEKGKTKKNKDNQTPFEIKEECLRFFRSRWYEYLTCVPADYLIKQLSERKPARNNNGNQSKVPERH